MIHKIRVSEGNQCIGCIFVDIPDQPIEPKEKKTLRDEFAIAALIGMYASGHVYECKGKSTLVDGHAPVAYATADLMLAERAKAVK